MKNQTRLKYVGAVFFIVLSLSFFFLIYLCTAHKRRVNDPLIFPAQYTYVYWKIAEGILAGVVGVSLFRSGRRDEKRFNLGH